jgi:hypothetical protein
MGFNKRFIDKNELIRRFRLQGHQGVVDYIGKSDVLLGMDDEIKKILNISFCESCDTNKNLKIKQIIDGK